MPGWHLYEELFEQDDVVYLELKGVQANITVIADLEAAAGTVLLRLPTATARQQGLVPLQRYKEQGTDTASPELEYQSAGAMVLNCARRGRPIKTG